MTKQISTQEYVLLLEQVYNVKINGQSIFKTETLGKGWSEEPHIKMDEKIQIFRQEFIKRVMRR